jgi:SPX domain protein involved in polyphosphate accumulation
VVDSIEKRLRVVDSIEKTIYCDNEPVVLYSYNKKKSDATKHINIKYYVVEEKIQDYTISLEHISTKQMLVNQFTKGLPPNVFK